MRSSIRDRIIEWFANSSSQDNSTQHFTPFFLVICLWGWIVLIWVASKRNSLGEGVIGWNEFSVDGVWGELSWGELYSFTSSLNFWYFLPLLMFVRCEKSIKCDWITAYFSGIFAVILCCYKQLPFYRWRVAPVQSIPLQPFVRKKVIVIMRWFTGGRRQFPLVWICLG